MNATDLTMPVLGGGRVLVVDGDEDSAAALTAVLRLHGFDARSALSPSESLEAALKYQPQAIIFDPTGLGLDWRKTARRLKTACPSTELIFLTGNTDSQLSRRAREMGAAGYFLKPAEPQELVELLNHLCDAKAV